MRSRLISAARLSAIAHWMVLPALVVLSSPPVDARMNFRSYGGPPRSSHAPPAGPQKSSGESGSSEAQATESRARPAVEPPRTEQAIAPSLPSRSDIYARRASEALKNDQPLVPAQHPLAEALPGHEVVVCVAGCGEGKPAVVSMIPKRRPGAPVSQSQPMAGNSSASAVSPPGGALLQTAGKVDPESTPQSAPSINAVECVAGCYGNPAPAPRTASISVPSRAAKAVERSWITTTKYTSSEPVRRKRASKQARGPSRVASGDWFRQINRERTRRITR